MLNNLTNIIPQSLPTRRALSASIAILFSIIADIYFSSLHQFWVPLLTIIFLLHKQKLDARDILLAFIVTIIGLTAAWFIIKYQISIPVINIIIFLTFVLLYLTERTTNTCLIAFFIPASLYLFWQQFWPANPLYDLLRDAAIAAGISTVTTLFIFPERADVDFRYGLIPVFENYKEYLRSIIDFLFDKNAYEAISYEKKVHLMKTMQAEESKFPEWVYHFGFNAFYRQGHRHFLIRTEQIGAVLFVMHQIARYDIDKNLLIEFRPLILNASHAIENLFQAIILRLQLASIDLQGDVLDKEIAELDSALQKITPPSLELIDISEDYLRLSAFVYEIKDLQKLLLKLIEALR